MNLYHKKQRWKLSLIAAAILMVAASLWFSSHIVGKVQDKELDRVQEWADAVKRKSQLVNLTNTAFDQLSKTLTELKERERKKVKMWLLGIGEMNKPLDDYTFVLNVVQANSNIPVIITDQEENVISGDNLGDLDERIRTALMVTNADDNSDEFKQAFKAARKDSLTEYVSIWKQQRNPIELDVYDGIKQKIFYFDSIYYRTLELERLERNRDSLSKAFTDELINNDHIPVMFIDKATREVIVTNIDEYDSTNSEEILERLSIENKPILVQLDNENEGMIYFEYSAEITQMKYFPYVQFFIIGLFVLIAYLVFSTFRKAEQDQVWVGMAKETAHQLGTPISSLMAWNQLLEAQGVDQSITGEINKDIERLSTVTNRFSKIGSESVLVEESIGEILEDAVAYLKKRISSKIALNLTIPNQPIRAMVNRSLLEWVIENITKNAVDAMEGTGNIEIILDQVEDQVRIDIADNGKGIPQGKLKTVFQPGFTTKKRGWGLGLSLVKRIVEDFHKGKVFVLKSEVNVGTTFRIVLSV